MDFGIALGYLKEGKKIARKGWNGKGMFIYYVPGGSYRTQTEVAKKDFGEYAVYEPYFAIKNVKGTAIDQSCFTLSNFKIVNRNP